MKLSAETLALLKNFATINPSILIKPGNTLDTVSQPISGMLARATVAETFPVEAPIYNLPELLGVLTLMTDGQVEFRDTSLIVSKGTQRIEYFYASPGLITGPPNKTISFDTKFKFNLSQLDVTTLLRAASVLQSPRLSIISAKGKASIRVSDPARPSSNSFNQELGKCDVTFSYHLPVANFRALSADYEISVAAPPRKLIHLRRTTGESLEYWFAVDPKSTMS
jgi:hypothetical protein